MVLIIKVNSMKKVKCSGIATNDYKLFICSSSFENRCLKIASGINVSHFESVIICHFEDNYPESDNNLIELQRLFNKQTTVIILKKDDPMSNFDKLFLAIKQCGININTLFDISTFTREILLIILRIFTLESFVENKLCLCYNAPSRYNDPINDNIWLSKGVKSIRSILGYPGDLSPIKRMMLIVLVGFEAERSQIIIDNFEPDKLSIGLSPSEGSVNSEIANINKSNFDRLKIINPNAEQFEFSCLDINTTKEELTKIITQNKEDYNIIICPMNNKLSTLAVASIGLEFQEVQICYSSTNQYNTINYSTPSDDVYLIDAAEIFNIS